MNKLILFLLESSLILGVLYLVYYLLLRKEASFNFNRFYLLGSLIFAFILPLLSIDFLSQERGIIDQPIQQLSDVRLSYQDAVREWSYELYDQDFSESSVSLTEKGRINLITKILLGIYGIGLIAMVFRLIWTLSWIIKLKSGNQKEILDGITIIKVPYQIAPFSFLNNVFVSGEAIEEEAFAHVLEHEKTHIHQRHSFDLLIVQLLTAIIWFNPVIWWLNKSLKTTHEYIADRNMIKQGYSLVEYQTLLLRQLISNNSFGLVHNFNLSFIKKRITMMNIQKIGHLGRIKVATVITMTALFSLIIVQCNSKLEENELALDKAFSVSLPVIQDSQFTFDVSNQIRFDITIGNDLIYFKDRQFTLRELSRFDGNFPQKAQMVLNVDKDQKMKLVHEVQEILREKDLRFIIYAGQNSSGQALNVPFMLPPAPNSKSGVKVPELTDAFIKENNLDLLRLHLGSDTRISSEVVDIHVGKHMRNGDSKYVIIGNYMDGDTFGNYLSNLHAVKQGFYDIYEIRAKELFGKSFYDINRSQKTSEEAKRQYSEVREGIPIAISVERM